VITLAEALRRFVTPGMHLHFRRRRRAAPTPQSARSAANFRGRDPRFTLKHHGFHATAHLLALLRLGARSVAARRDNYLEAPPKTRVDTRARPQEREEVRRSREARVLSVKRGSRPRNSRQSARIAALEAARAVDAK